MRLPQIIFLLLMGGDIAVAVIYNGEEKKGKHSFWQMLYRCSIFLALLWWGGFFG